MECCAPGVCARSGFSESATGFKASSGRDPAVFGANRRKGVETWSPVRAGTGSGGSGQGLVVRAGTTPRASLYGPCVPTPPTALIETEPPAGSPVGRGLLRVGRREPPEHVRLVNARSAGTV